MSHPINDQILENIYEEIQENYPNLSEKDQQQLAYKTMEDQSQWFIPMIQLQVVLNASIGI